MSENFQVIFTGALQPGKDAARIVDLFSEKFRLERAIAEKLIHAGRPVVLKKGLDLEKAEKFLNVLRLMGMVVELDPKPKPKPPEPAPFPESGLALEPLDNGGDDATEVLEPSDNRERCPKCGSEHMVLGVCQDCGIVAAKYLAAQSGQLQETGAAQETAREAVNPYSAPEAELVQPIEGELSGPRSVPAGNGLAWIGQGWWYFRGSPGGWILAMVVWFVLSAASGLIPVIGGIAMTLVGPVLMAGFMLGCKEQEEGGLFNVSHLFAGFSHNAGQLMLVGVLYMGMLVLLGAVFGAGMIFSLGSGIGVEDPQAVEMVKEGPGLGFILLMVLLFVLSIMVMMTYIFAPPLVAIENLNALEAMKLSFKGCLMNLLPLLLFTIAALLLMFIGVLPLGLGLLVVIPMLTASSYAAYRDIYYV